MCSALQLSKIRIKLKLKIELMGLSPSMMHMDTELQQLKTDKNQQTMKHRTSAFGQNWMKCK